MSKILIFPSKINFCFWVTLRYNHVFLYIILGKSLFVWWHIGVSLFCLNFFKEYISNNPFTRLGKTNKIIMNMYANLDESTLILTNLKQNEHKYYSSTSYFLDKSSRKGLNDITRSRSKWMPQHLIQIESNRIKLINSPICNLYLLYNSNISLYIIWKTVSH